MHIDFIKIIHKSCVTAIICFLILILQSALVRCYTSVQELKIVIYDFTMNKLNSIDLFLVDYSDLLLDFNLPKLNRSLTSA